MTQIEFIGPSPPPMAKATTKKATKKKSMKGEIAE